MAPRASSRTLADHDEIRRWAEERGARPSAVLRTEHDGDPGIIRLDFPDYTGEGSLEEIEWDEWFEKFDENNLALVVQDQTAGGQKSNFNKIVSRGTAQARTREARDRGRSTSTSSNRSGSRSTRTGTGRSTSARSSSRASSSRTSSRKTQSGSARTTGKKRAASHRGGRSRGRSAA
jgi:hypothetical protein